MRKVIWILLVVLATSAVVKRVDDRETAKLTMNDTVLSTLGMFRMKLKPNNCSLLIEKFNPQTNAYQYYSDCVSKHSPSGPCKYLTVENGKLLTDNGSVYSNLASNNYLETALTLDDTGVIRLQGVYNNSNPAQGGDLGANSLILRDNGTSDYYIEVHSKFN